MLRRVVGIVGVVALGLSLGVSPTEAQIAPRVPSSVVQSRLDQPVVITGAAALRQLGALPAAEGLRQVIVRLREAPVAAVAAEGRGAIAERAQKARVRQQQARFLGARGLRARASVQSALNAVIVDVDAAQIESLAADPEVLSVRPVLNYELHLTETVPYIGATAVQGMGYTGKGVRVAVLDSGIDYTHFDLGGSGNVADFTGNDPTIIEPGTFPTSKVMGGYDFVGEAWPVAPEAPDPDPLDKGSGAGHGTHVSDIIGGRLGVAPGVTLYAVKVCSSISTACSGAALLQGMDFAVDPDGDGDTSDHVDIVNMSLGAPYGQAFDDDLSLAVENATKVGVLTVASAGNSADKPYVHGSPASAPSALAVAETNVPSATVTPLQITAPATIAGLYNAVFQPWSQPLTSALSGPVQYGDGAGGNLLGCNPFAPGSLAGKIVLVDRGTCAFSAKISNVAVGNGLAGVIGLVAPGDPFAGAFGGGTPTVPGFMIGQADANLVKSQLGVGVSAALDPANNVSLVQHMVGGSSRGPAMLTNIVKPEIGAPGASVSAEHGTGNGTTAFGGTSGAAPMVSGSAALLMQAFPGRRARDIKAMLMTNAEIGIMTRPAIFGGGVAPISRIGGGEVRVDRAVAAGSAAYDMCGTSSALSFGFLDATGNTVLRREVVVRNYGRYPAIYRITPSFRYADDAASGAVKVQAPSSLFVPSRGSRTFDVRLIVKAGLLPDWFLNSGQYGASGDVLTYQEFDGYITIEGSDGSHLQVPWHVLPRKAGDIRLSSYWKSLRLHNFGAAATTVEAYSLIGKSGNLPSGDAGEQSPTPDLRYVGYATYDGTGLCPGGSPLFAFAINTWERQTHANAPASLRVRLDTDQDGTDDFEVRSADFTLNQLTDGRNLAWAVNLATSTASAFFYTSHDTNSANTVLYICGSQVNVGSGATAPMNVTARATDIYFGGPGDELGGITVAPFGSKYMAAFGSTGSDTTLIPSGGSDTLKVTTTGSTTNNTETGILLLYRGGAPLGREAAIHEPYHW